MTDTKGTLRAEIASLLADSVQWDGDKHWNSVTNAIMELVAGEMATEHALSDTLATRLIEARKVVRGRHSTIPYGPQKLVDDIDAALAAHREARGK